MQKTPTIKNWLNLSYDVLKKANISSYKLDAEILLAEILNKDRTYLIAHHDQYLSKKEYKNANKLIIRRQKRIPIAYLIGKKEFYKRDFFVTKDTLIPRPESEDIIDLLIKWTNKNQALRLIDVGTGSGCLGICAKLELPRLQVTLSDISKKALKIAKKNTKNNNLNLTIINSNILDNIKHENDIILANLPYVNSEWERSPETEYEPKTALFAKDNGLFLIKKLITQTPKKLKVDGLLFIESDPVQHQSITEFAKEYSLSLIDKANYILVFKKTN